MSDEAKSEDVSTANEKPREAVILMPTYNERENLPSIVKELLRVAPVDVLIIDDNSPDGTGAVADGLKSASGSPSCCGWRSRSTTSTTRWWTTCGRRAWCA